MFDFDEFIVSLESMGIGVSLVPMGGKMRLELFNSSTENTIVVVIGNSIEDGLARALGRLSESKVHLNEVLGRDKLTLL